MNATILLSEIVTLQYTKIQLFQHADNAEHYKNVFTTSFIEGYNV